jgi:hypothetical protein
LLGSLSQVTQRLKYRPNRNINKRKYQTRLIWKQKQKQQKTKTKQNKNKTKQENAKEI